MGGVNKQRKTNKISKIFYINVYLKHKNQTFSNWYSISNIYRRIQEDRLEFLIEHDLQARAAELKYCITHTHSPGMYFWYKEGVGGETLST